MELHYQTIVETLNEHFPELTQYEKCREIVDSAKKCRNSPYQYFPAFWKLLELVLTKQINNNDLQDRIFLFMEEMAKSDDDEVVNLLEIEMLEPIFGLAYEIYRDVVFEYLLPCSLELHQAQKDFFEAPKDKSKEEV